MNELEDYCSLSVCCALLGFWLWERAKGERITVANRVEWAKYRFAMVICRVCHV